MNLGIDILWKLDYNKQAFVEALSHWEQQKIFKKVVDKI